MGSPFFRRRLPFVVAMMCAAMMSRVDAAPVLTLAWDANTESDIAGYVVSYGTQSGVYTANVDVGPRTSWTPTPTDFIGGERYYFVVQAYATSGQRSGHSREVTAVAPYPPPVVETVTPAIGTTNGGTIVTLSGRHFIPGMVVAFGDKMALSTAPVNATTLVVTVPPGVAGPVSVTATNVEGSSGSLAGAFTYVSNVMTITSVHPPTGLARGGATLTIRGTNFTSGARVLLGGLAATNVRVVGPTLIAATAPARTQGVVDVRVEQSGQGATLPGAFTYVNGRPLVTAVTPRKGAHRGGTLAVLAGSNFVDGATVTVGGRPASNVVVNSPISITLTIPASQATSASAPRVADIVVTGPDGQSATLTGGYTYDLVPPTVASASPSSGPTTGGTQITLKGAEFGVGAVVLVGGVQATNVTLVNSTLMTAVVPPRSTSGAVDVLVRNVDGLQGVRQRGFTYVGSSTATDTDRDGLPDVFEDQMGLDPNSATGDDGATGDPDGDGASNLTEFQGGTHPRGELTRYFAEGVSSSFFTTTFALANPESATAHVLMRFMRGDGTVFAHPLVVPPHARTTVNARDIPAVATAAFSVELESDVVIVADRTMTWDESGYGAHAESAISAPALEWYLAEGATHSGFDLFYLVQNPQPVAANVRVRYLLPAGVPVVKDYVVPAHSRFNIWVDLEHPRLANADVSGVVTSTNGVPLIVERSMYLNAGGRPFGAGHNSAGVSAPATRWFLAEGATGAYFDQFVLVANPESTTADVKASFMLPSGDTVERRYSIPPSSRFNIWLDQEDPTLASAAVSTQVESTNGVPIIVERTMWWPGPSAAQWAEAHNSPGASVTSPRWALAEGELGGPQQRATFVLLANTSPYAGAVNVTLLFEDGTTSSKTYSLLAHSRFNVAVGAEFPDAQNRRFGVVVEAQGTQPVELVVERAMYWNAQGQVWAAGTNALGTPLQ